MTEGVIRLSHLSGGLLARVERGSTAGVTSNVAAAKMFGVRRHLRRHLQCSASGVTSNAAAAKMFGVGNSHNQHLKEGAPGGVTSHAAALPRNPRKSTTEK